MKKLKKYRYLGKNGIVTTTIELIGVEPIRILVLTADEDKYLTDGEQYKKVVEIFAEDLYKWQEVGQDELK